MIASSQSHLERVQYAVVAMVLRGELAVGVVADGVHARGAGVLGGAQQVLQSPIIQTYQHHQLNNLNCVSYFTYLQRYDIPIKPTHCRQNESEKMYA